jgi:hypothetical protein
LTSDERTIGTYIEYYITLVKLLNDRSLLSLRSPLEVVFSTHQSSWKCLKYLLNGKIRFIFNDNIIYRRRGSLEGSKYTRDDKSLNERMSCPVSIVEFLLQDLKT